MTILEQKKEQVEIIETWIADAKANLKRTAEDIAREEKALEGLKGEVAAMEAADSSKTT
jgi:hypothetical protein